MSASQETAVAQALSNCGGPPEIAPQLMAVAKEYGVEGEAIEKWITFHIGNEWSAAEFDRWCKKLSELQKAVAVSPAPTCSKHSAGEQRKQENA